MHRKDGTEVQMANHIGVVEEMKEMWVIIKRREVLLIVPLAIYCQWTGSYASTFLSLYFSVRARSLASFLVPTISVVANTLLGYFLDYNSIRKSVRAKSSYTAIMTLIGGVWVWFTIFQLPYLEHTTKYDWSSRGFGIPFACYLMYHIAHYVSARVPPP